MTQAEPLPHHPHLPIGGCGGGVVWVKAANVLSPIFPSLKKRVSTSLCSPIRGYRFKSLEITITDRILSNILANSDDEIVSELAR